MSDLGWLSTCNANFSVDPCEPIKGAPIWHWSVAALSWNIHPGRGFHYIEYWFFEERFEECFQTCYISDSDWDMGVRNNSDEDNDEDDGEDNDESR